MCCYKVHNMLWYVAACCCGCFCCPFFHAFTCFPFFPLLASIWNCRIVGVVRACLTKQVHSSDTIRRPKYVSWKRDTTLAEMPDLQDYLVMSHSIASRVFWSQASLVGASAAVALCALMVMFGRKHGWWLRASSESRKARARLLQKEREREEREIERERVSEWVSEWEWVRVSEWGREGGRGERRLGKRFVEVW